MRVLIAPQEYKGSLSAEAAAQSIARGLRRALPHAEVELLPLADGGPGTVDALVRSTGGQVREAEVRDPIGRPVRARWGMLPGNTAIVEIAAASGLTLLGPAERDPRRTSTYGTGELLLATLDAGCRRIIVGVGGSATIDGGAGMAQALGARLLDTVGRELAAGGAALARLQRIDISGLDERLSAAHIIVAADVRNPLCGPAGASLVYGPQKGATQAVAEELDAALAHYAAVIERDLGVSVADIPGAGAAGGLAAGLIAFCGGELRPGFDVVAEAVGLADRVRRADLVVTGEGRLDRQTNFGKTAAGVAGLAREAGKRVVAIAGSVEPGREEEARRLFDAVFTLTTDEVSQEDAMARAGELLELAAERVGEEMRPRG